MLFCGPAWATDDPYNPWVAAGLTYVPMAPAACAAGSTTGNSTYLQSLTLALTNPTPGLGHFYVGEPGRGMLILGTGLGLILTTLAANVTLYQGRRSATSAQDSLRDGINISYVVTSTALSLWAAWDAFRIAEEKNRAARNQPQ